MEFSPNGGPAVKKEYIVTICEITKSGYKARESDHQAAVHNAFQSNYGLPPRGVTNDFKKVSRKIHIREGISDDLNGVFTSGDPYDFSRIDAFLKEKRESLW